MAIDLIFQDPGATAVNSTVSTCHVISCYVILRIMRPSVFVREEREMAFIMSNPFSVDLIDSSHIKIILLCFNRRQVSGMNCKSRSLPS